MRVGITGIFASGKGTVCSIFEKLGAVSIDTDLIAREIVKPGKSGLIKIINTFGKDFLNKDGSLNRRKLAQEVFSSKKKTKILNNITHPIILEETIKLSPNNKNTIYLINTPLLFETDFYKIMDKTITIYTKTNESIKRGIERDNLSKKEIKDRLKNQFSIKKKMKLADYIIDNNYSLEYTEKRVKELWKILTMDLKTIQK